MRRRFRLRTLVAWGALGSFSLGGAALAAEVTPAFSEGALVATVHRLNRMEIDAGHMAAKNAATPAVKRYARMLVHDHARADRDLGAYARKNHLDPNATLPAGITGELTTARTKLDNLQTLHGSVFDEDFANLMVHDHQRAIALVKAGRAQAADPRLKTLLGQFEVELREHKQMAAGLRRDAGRVSAGGVSFRVQARRGHPH